MSSPQRDKQLGYLLVLGAGSLWGFLGLSCKTLIEYGFLSFDISFFRLFLGSFFILIYLLITDWKLLKIDTKGIIFTALIGFISQTLANGFYFYTIDKTTITTAVILLYTAPVFTNIISKFLYKEPLTALKIFSICLCFAGVFFTATGGDTGTLKFTPTGLIIGISAGFTFGLMPILNKGIIKEYNAWTILFYSFFWGSIFLLPVARPLKIFALNLDVLFWSTFIFLGLFQAMLAYWMYLKGLSLGVEPSKSSIISTVEIVVSVLVAAIVFHEKINLYTAFGIFMVAIAAVLIQRETVHKTA